MEGEQGMQGRGGKGKKGEKAEFDGFLKQVDAHTIRKKKNLE